MEPGVAAECLLALFGREFDENDADSARVFTGALILVEGLRDLKLMRKAWTDPPKE